MSIMTMYYLYDVTYNAVDMERVSAEFPELEEIPDRTVSLTEAVGQEEV
jgi:hypothetical protein